MTETDLTAGRDAAATPGAGGSNGRAELLDAFDAVPLGWLRWRRSSKWVAYPPDVLPVWVAELDVPLAAPIRQALHEAVELGDTGYAEPAALPEAFAGFADARLGWAVDPADLHVVPDVMAGIAEILRVATPPGAGVVVNPPVYPPFFDTVQEVGRQVVDVPLDGPDGGWRLDFDRLEAAFRDGAKAYLLCSPHNPVGRVWSAAELRGVADLAQRYGVLVLADEIHAPLVLSGAGYVPFLTLGAAAASCGIALTSASKGWNLAGLKCAVAVAQAAETRSVLARLPAEIRYRAGILGVLAGAAAFRDSGSWLDALLAHLDRTRRLLADLLAEHLPEVGYQPPQASYLGWLDCRELGLGDDPAAAFLERGRVALSPGPDFGSPGAGFARINLGTSRPLLTEAVRRMAAAVGR